MDKSHIFAKTAKGQDEISTRQDKLGYRERAALIRTDGKKTVSEVLELVPGGSTEMIEMLSAGGYIELAKAPTSAPVAPVAPIAPVAPQASAPQSAPSASTADLATRRRAAARAVSDLLGPNGDVLALAIEDAKTEEGLATAITKAANIIGQIAGAEKARNFASRLL